VDDRRPKGIGDQSEDGFLQSLILAPVPRLLDDQPGEVQKHLILWSLISPVGFDDPTNCRDGPVLACGPPSDGVSFEVRECHLEELIRIVELGMVFGE